MMTHDEQAVWRSEWRRHRVPSLVLFACLLVVLVRAAVQASYGVMAAVGLAVAGWYLFVTIVTWVRVRRRLPNHTP